MNFQSNADSKAADDLLKQYGRFIRNYKESTARLTSETRRSERYFQLSADPNPENASVFQLLESENKLLTRCLIVFYHLSKEARKLNTHSKLIANKLLIIEDEIISAGESTAAPAAGGGESVDSEANALVKFSYSLDSLFSSKFLIQNAIFLSVNVFQQYCALFSMEKLLQITPTSIFPSNMDDVMLLLKNLMIFDMIFRNGVFKSYLGVYSDLLQEQEQEQQQSDDDERYINLQNTLHELDLLLDGNIFQIALDNVVAVKGKVKTKNLKQFENFLLTYIKNLIYGINILGSNLSELSDIDEIMKLNIAVIVFQRMFESMDQKHLRLVIDINYKYPAIVVHGNLMINGNEMLRRYVQLERSNVDIDKLQQSYLNQRVNEINKDTLQYSKQVLLWVHQVHQQSRIGNENLNEPTLQNRCELYYQGLTLAGEMSFLIKTIVNLHAKLGQLMSKPLVAAIYKLTENLRLIRSTYGEKSRFISDSIAFVFQYLQFHTLNVIGLCKKKVLLDAKKERKFDLSTTLVLIEKLLYSCLSINNLSAITLALNLTEPFKNFGNEYSIRLIKLLDHMMTLCRLEEHLERVCDTSFLFWHQNLIESNLKQHMETSLDECKICLVLESIEELKLRNCDYQHLDNVRNFYPFVERHFSENVTRKLCNSIEINLRLDFHSNLQVEKFNPFDVACKILMEDRRALVKLQPTLVHGAYISIQDDVEFYLSKMFYNLTTISLKDWRTYEEMRRLAQRKYFLETVEDHLPTQTLEQGIDVLQIMRNIHLFVSRFNYNLNNQIFVESIANNNQHFNTIRINNIANSLSTHGFGIINTTVNFVYQFLRKKLSIFSQVVYDERIKSRLTREMKILRDTVAADKNSEELYSFERALSLHDYIKNLESFEGNQTLMDKIRALISSIGNSLGYIRMIKSGINHVNSNSISFVPTSLADEDEELEFARMCEELSTSTVLAAECVQKDIGQAVKKIVEGSLYFKMLMSTFSPYFKSTKNTHLKNFYLLVPALTINYIKYILKCKDRLKKNQDELVFTDDGFSMGIIYILRLLDQLPDYISLNWATTIRRKISADKDKIIKQREELARANKNNDEKLLQTLLLSEMRINAFQTEFELLFYNINSVKIFFQN